MDVPRRRRRLGRTMLVLGVFIVLTVFGARALPQFSNDEAAPLERRADGWYLVDLDAATRVDVVRVIDGDTLDVRDAERTILRVRLFGLSAAESSETCGASASRALEVAAGGEVLLLHDERLEDEGGRQLRYVFEPDGRSIDAALISAGLAEAWRQDGALRDLLVEIEDEAREAGRGCLWSAGDAGGGGDG